MKNSNQMDLFQSTSSQEDILANLSPLQVEKKVRKIRDTSGQSILDLSKSSGRLGSLERMLVDTLNSVSTPYLRTWRVKVTPLGRLVFQLLPSVPTTKEKESGLWLTPSATTISKRSKESMEKRKKYRESIGRTTVTPGNLAEQIQYGKPTTNMWPTPTTQEIEHSNMKLTKTGRRLTKDGKDSHSLNLADKVRIWRTPDAHCDRGPSSEERMKKKLDKGMPISLNDQVKHPNLMWPTPRSSAAMNENLNTVKKRVNKRGFLGAKLEEKVAMWPTPTSMDSSEDSLKSATKLMQGKTHRSSGERVQVKLSDRVMMEEIEKNPELMKIYQDHQMQEREHLPSQQEFVNYIRSQTTIKELEKKTSIKKTTIEHWFRRDKAGFSHPSVEDWNTIKPFLKEIKYDKEMTMLTSKEWTMWPTPRAALGMSMRLTENMAKLRHKKYLETEVAYHEHKSGAPGKGGGTLNPMWVEWLMGYPLGHTDLKD